MGTLAIGVGVLASFRPAAEATDQRQSRRYLALIGALSDPRNVTPVGLFWAWWS